MTFYRGQAVICVHQTEPEDGEDETFPVAGRRYTIRGFDVDDCLWLNEIVNQPKWYQDGGYGEASFDQDWFRPLTMMEAREAAAQEEPVR